MEIDGFDWDRGNLDKCQGHGVSIVEIETLFLSRPLIGPDPLHSSEEQRFRAAGKTATGRALFVVFTWRLKEKRRMIRPISARYMHQKEIGSLEEALSRISDR